jgi:hypothetical protein
VGHFKIGQQACFLVSDPALKSFLAANINNISFSSDQQLQLATHLQASAFVPLSDVPDVVWKTNINKVKPSVTRAMENWNHYADIDLPGANGKPTLLETYLANNNSLNWSEWMAFYKSAPLPSASVKKTKSSGALPFRVWQIFAAMVGYGNNGAKFLAAAGCLAHYVGDACQPLHGSQHSDGLNGATTGVHSTYEDNMVDAYADPLAAGIGDAIAGLQSRFQPRAIQSARDAAMAVMDLMSFCHTVLPPERICEIYNAARPGTPKSATKDKAILGALWDQCGQETIEVIAAGAVTLAAIWQAAWNLAGLKKAPSWVGTTYEGTKNLMPVYEDPKFLISLHLQYLSVAQLPGSNALTNPPQPPQKKGAAVDSGGNERGHQVKRRTTVHRTP